MRPPFDARLDDGLCERRRSAINMSKLRHRDPHWTVRSVRMRCGLRELGTSSGAELPADFVCEKVVLEFPAHVDLSEKAAQLDVDPKLLAGFSHSRSFESLAFLDLAPRE